MPACSCAQMRNSAASRATARLFSSPSSFARQAATVPASTDAGPRSGSLIVTGSMPTRHQHNFSSSEKCGAKPRCASVAVSQLPSFGRAAYLSATSGTPALSPSACRPAATAARTAGRSSLRSASASADAGDSGAARSDIGRRTMHRKRRDFITADLTRQPVARLQKSSFTNPAKVLAPYMALHGWRGRAHD